MENRILGHSDGVFDELFAESLESAEGWSVGELDVLPR
jgi:hypothetical protein